MKPTFARSSYSLITTLLFALGYAGSIQAQFYYRDLLIPRQTLAQLKKYKDLRMQKVTLNSFEADGTPTEDFEGSQVLSRDYTTLTTYLKTPIAGESSLTSRFNSAGQLIHSFDSTDGSSSTTEYFYNDRNLPHRIVNISRSAGQSFLQEEHLWHYDTEGRPVTMLRVKNTTDTLRVRFELDEKGNVAEENSQRNGVKQPPVYYYYDDENRLTDIVIYNQKARRLLPLYIFEYTPNALVRSMMVIPEGSNEYQRWVYEYDDRGLKLRETLYDKRKRLLGRISYTYK